MSLTWILIITYIISALIVLLFCKVLHSDPKDNALHLFLIFCPVVNTIAAIVYVFGDMWWMLFLWWDD